MNLENTILSERSHAQTTHAVKSPLNEMSRAEKSAEIENKF